jgi:hypothetical protein
MLNNISYMVFHRNMPVEVDVMSGTQMVNYLTDLV